MADLEDFFMHAQRISETGLLSEAVLKEGKLSARVNQPPGEYNRERLSENSISIIILSF